MDCQHIHLTKVANMNSTTYRCDQCHELYDIDLSANPYQMPKPVFSEESKKP
jgi:hypothetical protein